MAMVATGSTAEISEPKAKLYDEERQHLVGGLDTHRHKQTPRQTGRKGSHCSTASNQHGLCVCIRLEEEELKKRQQINRL